MKSRLPSAFLALLLTLGVLGACASAGPESQQIAELVQNMAGAVQSQDQARYLSYVDLSDPVFALEHARWSEEWARGDIVTDYRLSVSKVRLVKDGALAELKMSWRTAADNKRHRATLPVRFRQGQDGQWRYAGEAWVTMGAGLFSVHSPPGAGSVAEDVTAMLPEIYAYVTGSLDYEPVGPVEVKFYDTKEALAATTLLSLKPIAGWNEPGEAIKLYRKKEPDRLRATLTHEMAHMVHFAPCAPGPCTMPWWMMEGLAEYTQLEFQPNGDREDYIEQVQAWAADGELVPWEDISDFEATPVELWAHVYAQGYVMVRYVTESYGMEARNAWWQAVEASDDIETGTRLTLGLSLEELHSGLLDWLSKSG